MPVDTPHFAAPFSFGSDGVVNVVQQDTPAEIESCVQNIVSCSVGDCPDIPSFGIPDPLFANAPLDVSAIGRAIAVWEPRANATVTAIPDPNDYSHQIVQIEVT